MTNPGRFFLSGFFVGGLLGHEYTNGLLVTVNGVTYPSYQPVAPTGLLICRFPFTPGLKPRATDLSPRRGFWFEFDITSRLKPWATNLSPTSLSPRRGF